MTHAELEDLVVRFTETFNRDDLDGMMAFFAEDGVYDELNGTRSERKAAMRSCRWARRGYTSSPATASPRTRKAGSTPFATACPDGGMRWR